MAVDDNFAIKDLSDLMLGDLRSFDEFQESQLCIPQDPIEDLEWFPSFTDDFISLTGLLLTPKRETLSFEDYPAAPEHKNISSSGFPVTPKQKSEDNKRVPVKGGSSTISNKRHRIEDNETPKHETLFFEDFPAAPKHKNISSSGFPVTPKQKSEDYKRVPVKGGSSTIANKRHRIEDNETPKHETLFFEDFPTAPEHKNISSSGFPVTPKQKSEDYKRVPVKGGSSTIANKRHRIEDNDILRFVYVSKKKRRSIRPSGGAWSSKNLLFPSLSQENEDPSVEENRQMRCTHCQAEKTPQWRMGPMGPKTLCNACGVRYKSGRLLPDYRPAASPTFDCSKHSNFHKKLLKEKDIKF